MLCQPLKRFLFSVHIQPIILFIFSLASVVTSTQQDCGKNSVTDDIEVVGPRISTPDIGGEVVAGRGSWPWLASLGRFRKGKWVHFCGGSLVTDRHVLTAAHCVIPDVTAVRLGDGNLSDNFEVQRRLIRHHELHPKYKDGQPYFDVAVLTLDPPANISGQFVRPICLPDPTFGNLDLDEFDGDQMDIAGWGLTAKNGLPSETGQLRQVQQKIFKSSFCNGSHTTTDPFDNQQISKYLPQLFTPDLMCAGYEFGGSGSCRGDSGGPLMKYTYDNGPSSARFVQQGIVQGGVGICGDKDFPSIYVRIKDPEVFEFIQNSLAEPDEIKQKSLAQELHTAATNNNFRDVESILNTNEDNLQFINMIVDDGFGVYDTPLIVASFYGFVEIVEILVRKGGADPDIRDSTNFTAAYGASQQGYIDVLKILVEEANCNIDLHNGPEGNLVIMAAVMEGWSDIVSYLIPKVKDINEKTYSGYSSLYLATQFANLIIVKDLVLNGKADVNLKNGSEGWTALMRAAQDGALNIVKFLIEEGGADPTIKDNDYDQDALIIAAYNGKTEIVRYLVIHTNINVNGKDSAGYTPLYIATQKGLLNMIKVLVEHTNADINSKNENNFAITPLSIAASNGYADIVSYLLDHGAESQVDYIDQQLGYSALYVAVKEGAEEVVKILVEEGNANVELRNEEQLWTALHRAAYEGHLDIVKYLVEEAGADVLARTGDDSDTAQTLAEKNGHHNIVQYLKQRR